MKQILINISQSIESIFKVFIMSKFHNVLNIEVSSKKSCIILGNGPSLSISLKKYEQTLENHDLICVNKFVVSEFYTKIKPSYYILAAPIFYLPENELSPYYIDLRNQIFSNINEKTSWKLILMVPFLAKKSLYFKDFLRGNSNIIPMYFNPTPIEGFSFITKILFDLGLGMPRPHNVIIPAIMNCIKLKYKQIYLIGADHSWLPEISVNQENEALINHKHFYDEDVTKPQKMQDYISRPRKLHEIIHKFYLTFKGYWEIKRYADYKDVSIFNVSEYSMIDAFERKNNIE